MIENLKFFRSELYSQNENAESAEFLEKLPYEDNIRLITFKDLLDTCLTLR